MHEVHLAQSVLNIAIQEAQQHAARRIRSVTVTMVRFTCVNPESLTFCFEQVSRGTIAEGARLEVQPAKFAAMCPRCQAIVPTEDALFCPICGEPTAEIMAGQEIRVDSLEVES